jgi:hypothetical protein
MAMASKVLRSTAASSLLLAPSLPQGTAIFVDHWDYICQRISDSAGRAFSRVDARLQHREISRRDKETKNLNRIRVGLPAKNTSDEAMGTKKENQQ